MAGQRPGAEPALGVRIALRPGRARPRTGRERGKARSVPVVARRVRSVWRAMRTRAIAMRIRAGAIRSRRRVYGVGRARCNHACGRCGDGRFRGGSGSDHWERDGVEAVADGCDTSGVASGRSLACPGRGELDHKPNAVAPYMEGGRRESGAHARGEPTSAPRSRPAANLRRRPDLVALRTDPMWSRSRPMRSWSGSSGTVIGSSAAWSRIRHRRPSEMCSRTIAVRPRFEHGGNIFR